MTRIGEPILVSLELLLRFLRHGAHRLKEERVISKGKMSRESLVASTTKQRFEVVKKHDDGPADRRRILSDANSTSSCPY